VRELEAKNAVNRKKLMQTIFGYLGRLDVKASLVQEPSLDSVGVSVLEAAIRLKDRSIDSIHLARKVSPGCGASGEVLRFQYKLRPDRELPRETLSGLKVRTKVVKTGKVLGLFGGKIESVKWTGGQLADILNQDSQLSESLLRCAQIWGMELEIEAPSSSEVMISGPWFSNPQTIVSLYSPGREYEEQNCVFGYKTVEKIANIVREQAFKI
jgi:hypothetical protein